MATNSRTRPPAFDPARRRSPSAAGIILGLATVTSGLLAGLYYGFDCAVMVGLARTDDRTFIAAIHGINDAIQNPVFFATFLGAPILTAVAAVMRPRSGHKTRWLIVVAVLLHIVGFFITFAFNVPLNEQLVSAGTPDNAAQAAAIRDQFEGPWNAWNITRTLVSTAAFVFLVKALSAPRSASDARPGHAFRHPVPPAQ